MRPIDADALLKKDEWLTWDGDSYNVIHVTDVFCAPTLDVEPVRHGQWVFKYPNGWACSECGTWGLKTDQLGICKSKYCSECGAIMDLPS